MTSLSEINKITHTLMLKRMMRWVEDGMPSEFDVFMAQLLKDGKITMKPWNGLSRTQHEMLKFLRKQEASLTGKYDRMKQTIENRHLADEETLNATVGAELERIRAQIAEMEALKTEDGV